jgi:hypothetical protein
MKHLARIRYFCFAAALALLAPPASACEICVEDHVAATYDFAVIAKAQAAGHDLMFTAVRGGKAGAPGSQAIIRRAIAAVSGVDRDSIRLSVGPPAASFAWDPKRHPPRAILRTINNKLAKNGLALVALRTEKSPQRSPC